MYTVGAAVVGAFPEPKTQPSDIHSDNLTLLTLPCSPDPGLAFPSLPSVIHFTLHQVCPSWPFENSLQHPGLAFPVVFSGMDMHPPQILLGEVMKSLENEPSFPERPLSIGVL